MFSEVVSPLNKTKSEDARDIEANQNQGDQDTNAKQRVPLW